MLRALCVSGSGLALTLGIATAAIAPAAAQNFPSAATGRSTDGGPARAGEGSLAQASLDLALEELRQGRKESAQRRLEALIARYPDSEAATAARAKIVELYTAPVRETPPNGLGVPPPAPSQKNWHVEIRGRPSLAEEFRAKAGDRVFFAMGSAEISARAREALRLQAVWLKAHPGAVVTVEGHADDPGTPADMFALAHRRAEGVRRRLVEEGVAAQQILVVSRGAAERLALCAETMCAAQNRRAVTVVGESPAALPAAATAPGEVRGNNGLPR